MIEMNDIVALIQLGLLLAGLLIGVVGLGGVVAGTFAHLHERSVTALWNTSSSVRAGWGAVAFGLAFYAGAGGVGMLSGLLLP